MFPYKPKAERHRPKEDRDDFEPADEEEDNDHDYLEEAGRFAFRPEQMHNETADSVGLNGPNQPQNKKDAGHGESEIQIRIRAAKQGTIDVKAVCRRIVMAPTDRPHAGNESEPVQKQNEDENGREKPECFAD